MNWSMDIVNEKLKKGKIRGYVAPAKRKEPLKEPNGKIVAKHFKHKSKGKDFIAKNLFLWCQQKGFQLIEEYRFDEKRKFRFDWCIPEIMLAVEFEGQLRGVQGATHQSHVRFNRDIEKYNLAAEKGWKVLRFSFKNYQNLIRTIDHAIEIREV